MPGSNVSPTESPAGGTDWRQPGRRKSPWWLATALLVVIPMGVIAGCTQSGNRDGTPSTDRSSDSDVILPTDERVLLTGSRISTPGLRLGTSDWARYDSGIVGISDRSAVAASPVITVQGGMRGTASFDSIVVTEYDPEKTEIRRIVNDHLNSAGTLDWHEWSYGGDPAVPADFNSNATDAAAITGWSNEAHLFKVTPGNMYRIQGFMRGQNITPSTGADPLIRFQLDVYAQSPAG